MAKVVDSVRTPTRTPDRTPSVDDQASQLLLAFTRLARDRDRRGHALPAGMEGLLRSGVLAPRHLRAFALIALSGTLSVSELAAREGCALSTASLLVTQLSESGLVERRADEHDRRTTLVSVVPEHRRESEAILQAKLAPLRRALDRLGPKNAAALLHGLQVVAEEIANDDGSCSGAPSAPLRPAGGGT